MKNLNQRQLALLDEIRAHSKEGLVRIEVLPNEVRTAQSLHRRGLIILDSIQTGDRTFYEATLVDPNKAVVKDIEKLITKLQEACTALSTGTDPYSVLDFADGLANANLQVETLRSTLRAKAVEILKS